MGDIYHPIHPIGGFTNTLGSRKREIVNKNEVILETT